MEVIQESILGTTLKVQKKISEGFTSHVYKLTDNDDGKSYALKQFKSTCKTQYRLKEVAIQSTLDHENIIKIIKYDKINFNWIQMEFHGNCDLFDLVTELQKPLSEETTRYFFKQIIEAITYLHKKGIYHRDIKLENLLLCKETLKVKLCDFGYSVNSYDGEVTRCVGTVGYIAPEIQIENKYDITVDAANLAPADVFALGSLLFTIVLGNQPFEDSKRTKCAYWKMIQDKKWPQFWMYIAKYNTNQTSIEFKQLIEFIFTQSPNERITLDGFQNSSWMQGNCSTKEEVITELKIKLQK